MVSSSSSVSNKFEGTVSLDCNWKKIWVVWVVEVVKDGLITCERGDFGQKARLLSWRSASGILPRWRPHGGRGSAQGSGRRRKDRRNTQRGTKWGTERENKQSSRTHGWPCRWDDAHQHILEPCSVMCNNECVFTAWEKVTYEVYCLQTERNCDKTHCCSTMDTQGRAHRPPSGSNRLLGATSEKKQLTSRKTPRHRKKESMK